MYGAGQCFAYAATGDPRAQTRARLAFEALRFLQKVTQGSPHSPPHGFVARTIRPVEWPDPNIGRAAYDRARQQRDPLWKVIEPRWPLSADGRCYWKSDTSSDELDGHYFFYPLDPWGDWLGDAMSTLRGLPIDRLNSPHRNSQRLDVVPLQPPAVLDVYEPLRAGRGHRVDGRVLPVENRHFNHWNTDPWQLDYGGAGNELAAATVFLLPYYLGLDHGYIESGTL
jgi:hypothetical protein